MVIAITQPVISTYIVIAGFSALIAASIQRRKQGKQESSVLPPVLSQELKGLAILAIVFAHIGLFLADDQQFLFPLSVMAGVGVDLFLFLSGYGLTVGMLRQPLSPLIFYRRRLARVFIPFWAVLIALFVLDALLLDRTYSPSYMLRSLLGIFPRADMDKDVNSVFWYISWITFYYLLFPLLFMRNRLWLTALLLFGASVATVCLQPEAFAPVLHLYALHTLAFPLGVIAVSALQERGPSNLSLRGALLELRDGLSRLRSGILLCLLLVLAGLTAWHSGVNHGVVIEQAMSLLTMSAFLGFFMLKRFEIAWLSLVGLYSYEIYLLHWPLVSRYDWFYHNFPGWIATAVYIGLLLCAGWFMQQVLARLSAQGKTSNRIQQR